MTHLLTLFSFFTLGIPLSGQNLFDKELQTLCGDVSEKLRILDKTTVVLLYVTEMDKGNTPLGNKLANLISVNMVNASGGFKVYDRDNLGQMLNPKKGFMDGNLDAAKAKKIGKILSVEAIVIGNYIIFNDIIRVTLKGVDVETGFVIAASTRDLPLNADSKALLGLAVSNGGVDQTTLSVKENRESGNAAYVKRNCEQENIGDYCFTNKTGKKVFVSIDGLDLAPVPITSGASHCFYYLEAKQWNYRINDNGSTHESGTLKGQIKVEKCHNQTFLIE